MDNAKEKEAPISADVLPLLGAPYRPIRLSGLVKHVREAS